MSRFGAVPLFKEEKSRFGAVPVDVPAPQKPLNTGLGIARDLVEGIPIAGPLITGGVDLLGSEIIGRMTGEDPGKLREDAAARRAGYREENPLISGGAQLTGAMVGPAPLVATKVGQAITGITGPMWKRVLVGAPVGATVTGVDSLLRKGDPEQAMLDAAAGAVVGGGASAAAPMLAKGADAVVQGVRRMISPAARDAATGYSSPATQAVVRALQGDDSLGNAGAVNISGGGPQAMLADAGVNARQLLDTVIQRGGPGANFAHNAVEGRASQAADDIAQALDQSLGPPQGVTATETAIRRNSAGARSSAYDAAYASPIDYSGPAGRQIEEMLPRVPKGVIDLANRMMQMEGQQSAQILAQIADDGTVTFLRKPDVRQLDYITRALNTAAKSGEGQGALGGQTDIGRIYGNLAREIRDTVRGAVPEYDRALQTAAHPIQAREALRYGEGLLNPSITRDMAREEIEAMTGPMLAQTRQGLRSHIDDVLANVRAVASDPNIDARQARVALQQLSSPAAREKISMVLNDPAVANRLFFELGQAARALELRAGVATRSPTFPRLAMDEAVMSAQRDGIGNALMRGQPLNAGQRAIQTFFGRTPADDQRLTDEVYQEIAQMLAGPRGDQAIDLLSALANMANRPKPIASALPGAVPGIAEMSMQALGEKKPIEITVPYGR